MRMSPACPGGHWGPPPQRHLRVVAPSLSPSPGVGPLEADMEQWDGTALLWGHPGSNVSRTEALVSVWLQRAGSDQPCCHQ